MNFFIAGSVFSVISFVCDSRHRFQPIIIKNQREMGEIFALFAFRFRLGPEIHHHKKRERLTHNTHS